MDPKPNWVHNLIKVVCFRARLVWTLMGFKPSCEEIRAEFPTTVDVSLNSDANVLAADVGLKTSNTELVHGATCGTFGGLFGSPQEGNGGIGYREIML